ncbi:MAG TPA: hydrogenase maturation nickel metallochaperone HypA [Solirubrobacteraceae bacterium]|nr:hydrogenase maturation nickel metallochaperone HypA [Solirubrobacteraceae bacterium]
MHEHALARSILDAAIRHSGGHRVAQIDVAVGALRQVVPDSLAFHFEILARETPCAGARLEQHLRPARLRCACGEEWELAEPSFRCPRCDGAQVRVTDGEQLLVESIEIEEAPCIAPR